MGVPVVVVGGSAGALRPLLETVQGLEADFPAALVVVIHMPPDQPSALAGILERAGPLPAQQAHDGQQIRPGQIYTAVPGHHLLLDGDRLKLSLGPRENHSRPSIDVLFRSAARRGADAAGVLLSGRLDDGVSGLWTLRRRGGRTLVQHPEEADFPEMPLNGVRQVEVHDILNAAQLPAALSAWAWERQRQQERRAREDGPDMDEPNTGETGMGETGTDEAGMDENEERRLRTELRIAAGQGGQDLLDQAPLSRLACPECHGVMVQITEGTLLRFRCHTGHAYTVATLVTELREKTEASLWSSLRALHETQFLLGHLGRHLGDAGQTGAAAGLHAELDRTVRRAEAVRGALLDGQREGEPPLSVPPGS